MTISFFHLLAALAAGLIVTGWQAYKDSPWENFLWNRYLRSYLVVFFLLLLLITLSILPTNLGILSLLLIGCERGIGDIYKGFFRPTLHPEFSELFKRLKLPALFQYHWRVFAGIGALVFVFGLVTILFGSLIQQIMSLAPSTLLGGALIGFLAGCLSATGGVIKDSQFEGFKPKKFIRSPLVGTLAGIFLTQFENQGFLLAWALIGSERVIVELYKTFWVRQVRGIFENMAPQYPVWLQKRGIFLLQYVTGVIVLLFLFLVQ